jgi:hypothetical protein
MADDNLGARVLKIFDDADIHRRLYWSIDEDDGIRFYANIADVYAWGCADPEEITPDNVGVLQRSFEDLIAIDAQEWTAELFVARVRGIRPRGAAYPDRREIRALFDACGPERPPDPVTPKPPAEAP